MSIRINVSNQKAFLWDIKDIQTLRVEHHICGILTGTLPQVGQQNIFLGLPLMLLPEEVVLLVKNKIAYLVDDILAHQEPTSEQSAIYHQARTSSIKSQQIEIIKNEQVKKMAMTELYKEQIEQRRAEKFLKRSKKLAATVAGGNSTKMEGTTESGEIIPIASTSTLTPTSTSPFDSFEILVTSEPTALQPNPSLPSPSSPPPAVPTSRDPTTIPYTIQIHPSSTTAPWYSPSIAQYSTLEEAREIGLWNYPQTGLQRARCKIFEDLWRRGHFMGGALRFGGDFLIYPGDPLRFHSHFTLTVLTSPKSTIMPMDIVAYGRLATAVKKAHLLASWVDDDEKDEVTQKGGEGGEGGKAVYFSLEWSAFG